MGQTGDANQVTAVNEAMIGMMIRTIINILLDPIMILSLNLGVVGAAWATIIGNGCAVIYFIHYIVKKAMFYQFRKNFDI